MKKYVFVIATTLLASISLRAQPEKEKYPQPEFSNEVYFFRKDSAMLMRLEKGSSKMDTKTKMGGFGGAESGYEMDGEKSTTRLTGGNGLSFVFYSGSSNSSAKRDSMMRANGMDPALLHEMTEPSNIISLYKAETGKDKRKVLLQKSGGMNPFAGHKNQSGDKYTFSVKKIREGYWELLVDKSLPRGEYIFTMMNMGMGNMDGSVLLFAFAID